MSDTPRNDAAPWNSRDTSWMDASLCRQIDRELAAAKERIAMLEAVLSELVAMDKEYDRLLEIGDSDSDCAYRAFVQYQTTTWNEARNVLEAKP